jgi:hypothetical protein
MSPGGFKEVQCATGIRVKVIEDNLGCAVVRRLCCSVNNYVWPGFLQKPQNSLTVAYVEIMVLVPWDLIAQPPKGPRCVSLWPEKYSALVIVHAKHFIPGTAEMDAHFGTDQAAGSGD